MVEVLLLRMQRGATRRGWARSTFATSEESGSIIDRSQILYLFACICLCVIYTLLSTILKLTGALRANLRALRERVLLQPINMIEAIPDSTAANRKLTGYDFYRNILGSPKYVVAPMVDQSELVRRMMSSIYTMQILELGLEDSVSTVWRSGMSYSQPSCGHTDNVEL